MDLAAADPAAAADHLAKVYEWKYQEKMATAKAVLATGSALVLIPLLPIIQPDSRSPLDAFGVTILFISAAVLMAFGVGAFFAARQTHVEYLRAQSLLAELVEISPFIRLYRESQR